MLTLVNKERENRRSKGGVQRAYTCALLEVTRVDSWVSHVQTPEAAKPHTHKFPLILITLRILRILIHHVDSFDYLQLIS